MKLLAIETSTEACSVALHADGETIERFQITPRKHAEYVLPWAETLLNDFGLTRGMLDAVAVSQGPGAFTGVRLGIALAQGIALALERPLVPVSTLAVLAAGWKGTKANPVLATLDARMNEIYAGFFRWDDSQWLSIAEERVMAPAAVELPDTADRWIAVGTGLSALEGALVNRLKPQLETYDSEALPHAKDLAELAVSIFERQGGMAPERIEPTYLRNDVALNLAQQKALRASHRDKLKSRD